jgi:hypothetical protein
MKKSQKQAVAVGAGVAALAAAAAGAYFFTGKKGAKNRKAVSTWTTKAKRDVMAEMANMEKVTKQAYNKTVDTVLANYKDVKNVNKGELLAMAAELKGHWDAISSEVDKARKEVVRVLPVARRSQAKKVTVKKAPAKAAAKRPAPRKTAKKQR